MSPWDDGHMDAGWGVAMMIGTLAISILIAVSVVVVLQATRTSAEPPSDTASPANITSTAEQILAERLARGEIDSVEYRSLLEALASPRA